MMNIFKKDGDSIVRCEEFNNVNALTLPQNIIWIDLVHPSSAEVSYIAKIYGLDIPTKEEREEIEQSARYFEDAQSITINTYFLIRDQEMKLHNETVTFILFQKILFTIRYANFKVFNEIQRDILISPKNFEDGFDVISSIFELRVERDADMLEGAAELTKFLRKEISENRNLLGKRRIKKGGGGRLLHNAAERADGDQRSGADHGGGSIRKRHRFGQ